MDNLHLQNCVINAEQLHQKRPELPVNHLKLLFFYQAFPRAFSSQDPINVMALRCDGMASHDMAWHDMGCLQVLMVRLVEREMLLPRPV